MTRLPSLLTALLLSTTLAAATPALAEKRYPLPDNGTISDDGDGRGRSWGNEDRPKRGEGRSRDHDRPRHGEGRGRGWDDDLRPRHGEDHSRDHDRDRPRHGEGRGRGWDDDVRPRHGEDRVRDRDRSRQGQGRGRGWDDFDHPGRGLARGHDHAPGQNRRDPTRNWDDQSNDDSRNRSRSTILDDLNPGRSSSTSKQNEPQHWDQREIGAPTEEPRKRDVLIDLERALKRELSRQ